MQKFIFHFVLLFLFSSIVFSQADEQPNQPELLDTIRTYRLSDIVITATKTTTPMLEVASSVTVISETDLAQSNKNFVFDVLNEQPGLSVAQQGGAGKISRVFIRGANPHHTLVLVDGVEVNDPGSISNAFDFANLLTSNIERIEILRGPQSTLYGSDALAGVISIFTKKGTGKPKFLLSAEGGSYNSVKETAGLNGALGILDYSVNYSHVRNDGFSVAGEKYGNTEKDFYQSDFLNGRIGITPTNNLNFNFIYNFSKNKAGLDQNEKLGDDPNFISNFEQSSLKLNGNITLFDGLWIQNINVSTVKMISKTTDETDAVHPNLSSVNYFTGSRFKLEWQHNLKLNNSNTVVAGLESETEKAYSDYLSVSEWGPYSSVIPSNKATTTGLYLQHHANLFNSFFSTVGVRYDKHDKFGSEVTYRIAPAYFLQLTNTKFRTTYGTGFKSPSLYYLYEPTYGNPDLKPEKSKGWDAGIDQFLFNYFLTASVTFFQNDFTDLIGYDSNFKTINIDKAETKGVEVSINTAPFYNFSVKANYTYTEAKDKSTGSDDSGKELLRRPANKLALTVNYNYNALNCNLEIVNVGRRKDKDFSSYPVQRVTLDAYTLVNVSASYQLLSYLNVYGRIDNLLNADYEEVLFYGTPRLSAYAGAKFNF